MEYKLCFTSCWTNIEVSYVSIFLGGGDVQTGHFSGGDDETENEDQVDHIASYSNGFPNFTTVRSSFSKGDFSFGENELDMELDTLNAGE